LQNFINTTADVSQQPFYLLVALTCPSSTPNDIQQGFNTSAKGMLYVDDGITPVDQNPPVENLDMKVDNNQLSVTRLPPPAAGNPNGLCDHPTNLSTSINKVIVYGAPKVTKLFVDGAIHNFTQTDDTLALHIKDINYDWCVSSQLNITWV
ncbi:putative Sucrase-isomaltase-like 2, partial [Homarus americanus]